MYTFYIMQKVGHDFQFLLGYAIPMDDKAEKAYNQTGQAYINIYKTSTE